MQIFRQIKSWGRRMTGWQGQRKRWRVRGNRGSGGVGTGGKRSVRLAVVVNIL